MIIYTVAKHHALDNDVLLAKISGQLAYNISTSLAYPVVGDIVAITHSPFDKIAIIHRVCPRKSLLSRVTSGSSHTVQPIAANIDIVFVTTSLDQNFNLSRIERYLSVALESGAQPAIILTKADLVVDLETKIADLKQIAKSLPIFVTDSHEFAALKHFYWRNHKLCLSAHLVSEKSTLINREIFLAIKPCKPSKFACVR